MVTRVRAEPLGTPEPAAIQDSQERADIRARVEPAGTLVLVSVEPLATADNREPAATAANQALADTQVPLGTRVRVEPPDTLDRVEPPGTLVNQEQVDTRVNQEQVDTRVNQEQVDTQARAVPVGTQVQVSVEPADTQDLEPAVPPAIQDRVVLQATAVRVEPAGTRVNQEHRAIAGKLVRVATLDLRGSCWDRSCTSITRTLLTQPTMSS